MMNLHKSTFVLILLSAFVFTSISHAELKINDTAEFQRLNQDGYKYEFVRTYINSLEYVKSNEDGHYHNVKLNYNNSSIGENANQLITDLVNDDANLRVARNILLNFKKKRNALMLKATDLFTLFIEDSIAINKQERDLLKSLSKRENPFLPLNRREKQQFLAQYEGLANQKKEASKDLLEASLLVSKILVSSTPDRYGDFETLGVTDEQRQKLLDHLVSFYGDHVPSEIEEGLTFIEASVVSIKSVLEDPMWYTFDG